MRQERALRGAVRVREPTKKVEIRERAPRAVAVDGR